MTFDKKSYWDRRKKGLRGQSDVVKEHHTTRAIGIVHNREMGRRRNFQKDRTFTRKGFRNGQRIIPIARYRIEYFMLTQMGIGVDRKKRGGSILDAIKRGE